MWEGLADLNSLTVFIAIGAVGLIFLLFTFFFGELFEGGDHHFETDVADHGPGLINLRTVSLFLTALGGIGALARLRGYGSALSSLAGFAGGIVLSAIVFFYTRFLFRQQASSLVSAVDLVGQRAEVIVGIPAGGAGQVRCLIGESWIEKIARTRDGSAVAHGSTVMIEEIAGEGVIVTPWRSIEEGRSLFEPPKSL